jgi:hypothetical protein
MPFSGPKYPGTIATDETGDIDWANVARVGAADSSRATATAIAEGNNDTSIIEAENFGFALPARTITGFVVEVDHAVLGNGPVYDIIVQLYVGSTLSANRGVTYPTTWTDEILSYGSPTDLWGLANPSSADVNNAAFAVYVSAKLVDVGLGAVAGIDFIRVTVYYQQLGRLLLGVGS